MPLNISKYYYEKQKDWGETSMKNKYDEKSKEKTMNFILTLDDEDKERKSKVGGRPRKYP